MLLDTLDRSPFDHLAVLIARISALERMETRCRAARRNGVDIVGPSVDAENELVHLRRVLEKLVGPRRSVGSTRARTDDYFGRNG
jgi:hypothetical protein